MEFIYNSKGDYIIGGVDKVEGKNSGWFATYLMPNQKEDKEVFRKKKVDAIKWIKEQEKKKNNKKPNVMATSKTTATPKKKTKKRTSATSLCRKVIKVPGLNSKGQLLKGWHYVNGKPVKSKPAKPKKKTTAKAKLSKPKATPSAKQKAAQSAFKKNSAKARALVASGKAKNLAVAWKQIK